MPQMTFYYDGSYPYVYVDTHCCLSMWAMEGEIEPGVTTGATFVFYLKGDETQRQMDAEVLESIENVTTVDLGGWDT